MSEHQFNYDPEADVCYRTLDFMGYPGYRVGDDGSVWSCRKRMGCPDGKGCYFILRNEWKRMCPAPMQRGHLLISLSKGGKRYTVGVHALVLKSFNGWPPEGMECCHNDGVPDNNRLENLRWGTDQENCDDQGKHGVRPLGVEKPGAKLTDDIVRQIRAEFAAYGNAKAIAKRVGICPTTARNAIARRNWKHVV